MWQCVAVCGSVWPGARQLQAGEAHLGGVRVGCGRVGLDPCRPKDHALVHAAVAALTVREEAHGPLLLAPQAGCSLRGGRPSTDSCGCHRGESRAGLAAAVPAASTAQGQFLSGQQPTVAHHAHWNWFLQYYAFY